MDQDTDNAVNACVRLSFATIKVRAAADKMSVKLTIEPISGEAAALTAEHLEEALADAGVVYGVNRSAIEAVVKKWNDSPRALDTPVVAEGVKPQAAKEGALRVIVKHLSSANDIRLALGRKFFWEVASISHRFQRVDQGTVVARRDADTPGVPGRDVFGGVIIPEEIYTEETLSGGITEKNNLYIAKNTYTAAKTGIVFVDGDGEPHVMPLDFDGVFEIHIASNMMSAELTAMPAGTGGTMPSGEYLRNLIKNNRIVFGIDDMLVETLITRYAQEGLAAKEVNIIATGKPPVKGDDGRVEFCFDIDSSPAPVINEDGSADYKNIDIVTPVKAGSILARLLPPTKGERGMDVMGHPLPALDGNPATLPVGANTAIPKDDPSVLVSITDGIVRYDDKSVNVTEGYIISGDVDYSTGNVSYENSITVKGDVKSGFEVRSGSDLQVNGIVEDSKLVVKGNVLCKFGFVGNGKGIIEADGDVSLGYAKNQTIVTKGDVTIAKEAINCNITARNIHVYGHSLSVAGGILTAAESIVVKTVGNLSGIKTTLQISSDPELSAKLFKVREDADNAKADVRKLSQTLNSLPPAKRLDTEFMNKLKNSIITMQKQALALEEKAQALSSTLNNFDNAFIRIDRCAYPGTTFKFGDKTMTVNDILAGGKTIRVVNYEIKVI